MADNINLLPPDGRTRPAQERDARLLPSDADTKLHVPPPVPQAIALTPSVTRDAPVIRSAPALVDAAAASSLLDQKIEPVPTAASPKAPSVSAASRATSRLSRAQKWLLIGGVLLVAALAGWTVYLFWSL